MALPEQIRKQTEAVQQLYAQLNADDGTGAGATPAESSTPPETTPVTPPAPDSTATTSNVPPPAHEQKLGDERVPEETVVQKYKTLQGMYNAEVPRLHQQNKELGQRLQQMEQLLASLSAQSTGAPPAQPTATKLVSDKDVEEYGDSLDVMRRVSREEIGPLHGRLEQIEGMLRQMQTNVVPQVQAVAQRQQVTAEEKFWADLTVLEPTFREINANEQFQSWLLEADPLTGITRQTYLDDAQRALDASRVSNFFRAWRDLTGQADVAQSNNRAAAATELEQQVAPGRSRGGSAAATPASPKTYSPKDIQKFFDDVRSGKYKGRDADRARIERDIFAAQRENRIVANA